MESRSTKFIALQQESVPFSVNKFLPGLLLLGFLALVGWMWYSTDVQQEQLLWNVPIVKKFSFLETSLTYFYLHVFTFVPVFILSFDRRVHYYKKWKYVFPSILLVAAFFIIWDVIFTWKGVWGFNEHYFLGYTLFYLPVEEWLFFFTIPFACVFIYECLNYYVPIEVSAAVEKYISLSLILLFLLVGFWNWGRWYTCTTFLWTAGFLLYHVIFVKNTYRARFYFSYLISLIPFFIVNGVLTGGYTDAPVVLYNPEEYLGIRITSVPADDIIYGFLLMMSIITLFEYFRAKKA